MASWYLQNGNELFMFARMTGMIVLTALFSSLIFCSEPINKSPIINPPDTLLHLTVIDWGATWCAANDMIAYMHGESYVYPNRDSSGLYVIRQDGTDKRALFYEHFLKGVDWSPDGRWLVVHLRNHLVKLAYPDGILDTLLTPVQFWNPAWSPDGMKIIGTGRINNVNGICSINPDGSDYKLILPYADYPTWIYPDSFIYLNGALDFPSGAICLADSTGSFRRLFLEGQIIGSLYFENIKSSLPTRRVVFEPFIPSDTSNLSMWKYDTEIDILSRFVNFGQFPNFSPNGEEIVYTYARTGNGNLVIINWNGTGARQLTQPINGSEP